MNNQPTRLRDSRPDRRWFRASAVATVFTAIAILALQPADLSPVSANVAAQTANQPPVAVDDSFSTPRDVSLVVPAPGILLNDTDPDGDSLMVFSRGAPQPASPNPGNIAVLTDGSFIYNPAAGFVGTLTFTYRATDLTLFSPNEGVVTIEVTSDNTPPVADAGGPYYVAEGGSVILDSTASADPDGDPLTHSWDLDGDNIFGETGANAANGDETGYSPTFSAVGLDGPGSRVVSVMVVDSSGAIGIATAKIDVTNVAPVVSASDDTIDEGGSAVVVIGFSDPGTPDTHAAAIDWGDGSPVEDLGAVTSPASPTHLYPEDGVYNVLVTVSDNDGASGSASATVTVNNMAPVVEAGPDAEVAVGSPHSLAPATFSNAGANDSHVSVIDWGDGTLMDGLVTESSGSGSITGSHAYALTGSYTVTVTATDDDGGSGQDTFIVTVIAEPSAPSEPASGTDELDTRYMTGGGNRSVGNGEDARRYSWGFKIRCDGSKGSLQFNDHATSSKFHLESIQSVTCWSQPGVHEGTLFDSLSLVGSGRWNGEPGARIEATMVSAGESDGSDRLELLIWNASGTPVETVPSALSGGNHKTHQGVDGEEDATEPVLLLDAPSEPKLKVTREAPSEHAAHAAVNHIRTSLMRIIAALLAWWQNFFAAGLNSQPDARPATLGHAPFAGLDSTAWAWAHSGSPDLKRSARNTR